MSSAAGVIAFVLAFLMGMLLLFLIGPWRDSLCGPFLLRTCISIGFGVGVSSCLFFVWLLVAGSPGRGIAVADILVVLALAALAWPAARRGGFRLFGPPGVQERKLTPLGAIPSALFVVIVVISVAAFVLLCLQRPHGGWDAWGIWNCRARFLFRGGPRWTDAFSPLIQSTHPDYPLLGPSFVARAWSYIGSETVLVPIATSFLFVFATVGLLVSSLGAIRSRAHGLIAGIALLGTPTFAAHGVGYEFGYVGRYFQYMDIPLAFYMLAAIAFGFLQDMNPRERAYSVLAGVSAGLACWTKNEGIIFLVIFTGSRLISAIRFRQSRSSFRECIHFLGGLAPILAVVFYFKWSLAPPNDMVSEFDLHAAIAKLADPERYRVVAAAWSRQLLFRIPAVPTVLGLALIGVKTEKGEARALASSCIAVAGMLVAYFFVYVVTSKPLQWHMDTSLSRLLLQVFPSFLFVAFLLVPAIRVGEKIVTADGLPEDGTSGAAPDRRAASGSHRSTRPPSSRATH